jgi:hypothetical protein
MMNATPQLVFLYGPPAVGKLTVAGELAKRRPFRVLHNHVTIDAVATVLPFGTDAFWSVVGRLRRDLAASAASEGIDLVYTYVFTPGDEPRVDAVTAPYENAGGVVTFVRLFAPPEELLRRVGNASRLKHGKIIDEAPLQTLLAEYDLYTEIPGRDSLSIDVEALMPPEAADVIIEHLDTQRSFDDGHGSDKLDR